MLESCFVRGEERQEMLNDGKPADGRRCRWSKRHCIFVVLVFVAVFFFYTTNINTMAPDWNPKAWMQNSSKWWSRFKGEGEVSQIRTDTISTSRSTDEPVHAATANLSVFHQTNNITSAQEANTTAQSLITAAPVVEVQPIAVPYVSPGPYVVEYPYKYHFTINEPQKCEQEKPFVVLMVPVAPHNRQHRDDIRSTWGSESSVLDRAVRLFFILGLTAGDGAEQIRDQLLQESNEHHDLIQADFLDCYKNLTIKTMVMLEWLNAHCSGASYAMKIDSDMFLNVPKLVEMLLNAPKTNYMTGLVAAGGQVLRDPASKWFLPVELYPHAQYPRYALGLGYIVSLDLPEKLIEASRHLKALYIEDVYLGLCMQHLDIPPTDPPSGAYFNVFPVQYTRCAYSRLVATTVHAGTDRIWVWKDFKKPGPYC
ncbi:beta-1,3-galactosyltransferase 1-like [Stegastes partitus]|uniref:Hexosyltransferase n=1 Tax=Stegastes partitus TaxID=144197 RepID=A0A3B5B5E1_9TELE|nr:PREDICTED: beta-1,3-galactosyltransferase 1-like [Stegastes partitus]